MSSQMINKPVSELEGAQLDWAVAQAGEEWKQAHIFYPTITLDPTFDGVFICNHGGEPVCFLKPRNPMRQDPQYFRPSTDWRIGGPILARMIESGVWCAEPWQPDGKVMVSNTNESCLPYDGNYERAAIDAVGPTLLVAAMRAFVIDNLGPVVTVPVVAP